MHAAGLLIGIAHVLFVSDVPPQFEPGCGHAKCAATHPWALPPGVGEPAGVDETDVLHHHLDLSIYPTAESLAGSNRMTIRSLADGLSSFTFWLSDTFSISAVRRDGVDAAFERLDSRRVRVTLEPPVGIDETFELYVEYAGIPQAEGFGSIRFHTRNSGARTVWTLSETDFAYTWWPNKGAGNLDKTTADLWFTVPDTMVVASNGLLQGVDDVSGGQKRYRWKTTYPTATYLYSFVATNFEQFGTTWNYGDVSMPLEFFIYPESNNSANRDAWLQNASMLTVFSDRFGVYPFADEKYGMAQFSWGGGMEHQTITSQGGFWESVTAHELAHQWWGDMITCAFWNDIWLNEGFATYGEAIWYENRSGSPDEAALHDHMAARRPGTFNGSVYVYDPSDLNAIFNSDMVYRKGAWVLHMLRHVVGDEAFFDILAAYREAYAFGAATTADFQLVAEQTVGQDLDWYFEPWVYGIGAPNYRYAWRQSVVAGRNFVELYVRQVQNPSWPVFTMPIDIRTTTAGVPTTHVVWNDAAAEHLLFETSGPVSALAFDPNNWILHNPTQTIAFVEGPPKIVEISPPPAGEVTGQQAATVSIVFHKAVAAQAGDFSISGGVFGDVAFEFAYDGASQKATLTAGEPLRPDVYTISVLDSVKDVAAGLALDGELLAAGLPSGDGLPGGAAVWQIVVGPPGDLSGDGYVDQTDLGILLSAYGLSAGGDLDGDGITGQSDLGILLAHYGL
ncbi:MAG: hypothetical protein LC135_07635 [Phycisphaerae bacterium]|nr:hypothetical protein [Phycisphaerae bacterium]MCZ2399725.1 hypothetical protein [Phycisphaerae bacterium]